MHASFVDAAAYERMVDDYLVDCRRQNVRYAEVHFTPYHHEFLGKLGARAASMPATPVPTWCCASGDVVFAWTDARRVVRSG